MVQIDTLPRILIVDDETLIIRMLNKVLKSRYAVQWASSGREALEMAVSDAPELILLDVGLPDMEGYEVCRQLRDNPATRVIPVIFLTNHDKQEEILQGFQVGGRDYVLKNAGVMELMARIDTHLQLHRQKVALEASLEQNRRQNDKMVSLGQLVAGVAHEINNPLGYVFNNLQVLARYFTRITDEFRLRDGLPPTAPQTPGDGGTVDITHALADGVELIKESLEGVERVMSISQGLKNFSRMDELELKPMALNACLESALTICCNELKYVATIRKEYEPIPDVLCHPGQLSQVFLNLLVNAGQAIVPMGEIVLRCWHDTGFVYASVSDTGVGIPQEMQERIFDPFYTTKEVGVGTGLGLSISHDIVAKHNGKLLVKSSCETGTTFTVMLPRTETPGHDAAT
jgi:two-component system, NtrC family, sensor kinase